jgi:hypothetical protein
MFNQPGYWYRAEGALSIAWATKGEIQLRGLYPAAVGVDRDAAVGLDEKQPRRGRQMGSQAPGIIHCTGAITSLIVAPTYGIASRHQTKPVEWFAFAVEASHVWRESSANAVLPTCTGGDATPWSIVLPCLNVS